MERRLGNDDVRPHNRLTPAIVIAIVLLSVPLVMLDFGVLGEQESSENTIFPLKWTSEGNVTPNLYYMPAPLSEQYSYRFIQNSWGSMNLDIAISPDEDFLVVSMESSKSSSCILLVWMNESLENQLYCNYQGGILPSYHGAAISPDGEYIAVCSGRHHEISSGGSIHILPVTNYNGPTHKIASLDLNDLGPDYDCSAVGFNPITSDLWSVWSRGNMDEQEGGDTYSITRSIIKFERSQIDLGDWGQVNRVIVMAYDDSANVNARGTKQIHFSDDGKIIVFPDARSIEWWNRDSPHVGQDLVLSLRNQSHPSCGKEGEFSVCWGDGDLGENVERMDRSFAVSPDGMWIASTGMIMDGEKRNQCFIDIRSPMDGNSSLQIDTYGCRKAVFTQDSASVVFQDGDSPSHPATGWVEGTDRRMVSVELPSIGTQESVSFHIGGVTNLEAFAFTRDYGAMYTLEEGVVAKWTASVPRPPLSSNSSSSVSSWNCDYYDINSYLDEYGCSLVFDQTPPYAKTRSDIVSVSTVPIGINRVSKLMISDDGDVLAVLDSVSNLRIEVLSNPSLSKSMLLQDSEHLIMHNGRIAIIDDDSCNLLLDLGEPACGEGWQESVELANSKHHWNGPVYFSYDYTACEPGWTGWAHCKSGWYQVGEMNEFASPSITGLVTHFEEAEYCPGCSSPDGRYLADVVEIATDWELLGYVDMRIDIIVSRTETWTSSFGDYEKPGGVSTIVGGHMIGSCGSAFCFISEASAADDGMLFGFGGFAWSGDSDYLYAATSDSIITIDPDRATSSEQSNPHECGTQGDLAQFVGVGTPDGSTVVIPCGDNLLILDIDRSSSSGGGTEALIVFSVIAICLLYLNSRKD